MSEFKYACPVCGQHIKCDSSQAGTVMDCPTCFQKITVPQASAEGQKFILTGSKVTEKPLSAQGLEAPATAATSKSFPGALVVMIILAFMGTAAAAIYWATIIHPRQSQGSGPTTNPPVRVSEVGAKPKPPPKPALVAPPANDTNWMLVLNTNVLNAIPASPVAGRILAHDFIAERSSFQNGILTFRAGKNNPLDLLAVINFSGVQPEDIAGKTINVTTNAEKAARVTLRWKDEEGNVHKQTYDNGYALHLEFGALANNRLPGTIYLCAPDDEKSYLMGTFNADARKPKPKQPPKQ